MGAEFGEGAVLTYPVADLFRSGYGTLSLWVYLSWDSVNAYGALFFLGVSNPDGGERTFLGFLGKNGLLSFHTGPLVSFVKGDLALWIDDSTSNNVRMSCSENRSSKGHG